MQQVLMHMPNKAMLLDSQPYGESACKQQFSMYSMTKVECSCCNISSLCVNSIDHVALLLLALQFHHRARSPE